MTERTPRFGICLPPDYTAHFDEMAAEAGLTRATLVSSLLMALANDDRAAHGLEPLSSTYQMKVRHK